MAWHGGAFLSIVIAIETRSCHKAKPTNATPLADSVVRCRLVIINTTEGKKKKEREREKKTTSTIHPGRTQCSRLTAYSVISSFSFPAGRFSTSAENSQGNQTLSVYPCHPCELSWAHVPFRAKAIIEAEDGSEAGAEAAH